MQNANSGNNHQRFGSASGFAIARKPLIKWVGTLSSVAIVSCLNVYPSLAMIEAAGQAATPTPPRQTEPLMMAGLFGDILNTIEDAADIVNTVTGTVNTVTTIVEQENRRQELEEARRAASERDRLEAERRQQYFESLSPEEQQAYIAQQQAMQAQRDEAASLFLLGVAALMFGGSSGAATDESANDICYVFNSDGSPSYSARRSELSNFDGVECSPN
ncbi:hypothetical protein H6F67_12250 [Microcoleus sp. FACHB-1515]|uniref:hypothetical protein n=1 Tax=Cyanophyceae TaxID=3028117 RepID=UPI001686BABA|nr:hypothetical protein [Microcoleus sp. FACHB-1515]MBD2090625.1 hypothetical protein [Microcoleus sp. FACHB-1515]